MNDAPTYTLHVNGQQVDGFTSARQAALAFDERKSSMAVMPGDVITLNTAEGPQLSHTVPYA
jgi:hypothetical protein